MHPPGSTEGVGGEKAGTSQAHKRSLLRLAGISAFCWELRKALRPWFLFSPSRPEAVSSATTKKFQVTPKNVITYTLDTHPNTFEDPDPASPDLSSKASGAHKKTILAFGDEMVRAFEVDETVSKEL